MNSEFCSGDCLKCILVGCYSQSKISETRNCWDRRPLCWGRRGQRENYWRSKQYKNTEWIKAMGEWPQ